MFNFINEVEDVRSRSLRYFFVVDDYFHDVIISSIQCEEGELILNLRAWEEPIPGLPRPRPGNYRVRFRGCAYVEIDGMADRTLDYGSGRIKNSVRLASIQAASRFRYYHLRMHTPPGYIDVIFRDVDLTTDGRRLDPPKRVGQVKMLKYFGDIESYGESRNREDLRRLAASGEIWDRFNSITYLAIVGDESTAEIAMRGLDDEDHEEPWVACVWALGWAKAHDALPALAIQLANTTYPAKRRLIFDAIERILAGADTWSSRARAKYARIDDNEA